MVLRRQREAELCETETKQGYIMKSGLQKSKAKQSKACVLVAAFVFDKVLLTTPPPTAASSVMRSAFCLLRMELIEIHEIGHKNLWDGLRTIWPRQETDCGASTYQRLPYSCPSPFFEHGPM